MSQWIAIQGVTIRDLRNYISSTRSMIDRLSLHNTAENIRKRKIAQRNLERAKLHLKKFNVTSKAHTQELSVPPFGSIKECNAHIGTLKAAISTYKKYNRIGSSARIAAAQRSIDQAYLFIEQEESKQARQTINRRIKQKHSQKTTNSLKPIKVTRDSSQESKQEQLLSIPHELAPAQPIDATPEL